MECVAYLRVSTEKQVEEGNGLDSQRRDIDIYARKNQLIISDWYIDDGYTGTNMDRPQLQRLINDCSNKKVKCVVAFKLDRISRSMVDGIYIIERIFQKNDVKFLCVHDSVNYDSPMEQAYTQMMAVFSQLDKNTMMLRMRGGMLERVKKGYWYGGGNRPYCYDYSKDKGYLVPIPDRAEQARSALDLFLEGYSDLRIQKLLGYNYERTVYNILTNPVNIGMIPYKGNIYQGLHEPIFDKEKFMLAQEMRASRRINKTVSVDCNMLTGLCYCGVCGCAMRYQKWTHGKHRIYCCSRNRDLSYLPNHNPDCDNELIWASDVESQVESKVMEISLNLNNDFPAKERKVSIIEKQISREITKLKRLYALYAEGNDTVIEMISNQEKEIERMKEDLERERRNEELSPKRDTMYKNIKKIADIWRDIDKKSKNTILKSIIDKIVIVNGNIDIVIKNF